MKIGVSITEILSRTVFIDVPDEVENKEEYAEFIASKQYGNEEITLDYNDLVETEIKVQVDIDAA